MSDLYMLVVLGLHLVAVLGSDSISQTALFCHSTAYHNQVYSYMHIF